MYIRRGGLGVLQPEGIGGYKAKSRGMTLTLMVSAYLAASIAWVLLWITGKRELVWYIVVAVILALLHFLYFNSTDEDAYIIFRYAENFGHGHGLVFNPGERVEGYTCFLWVLLLGLAVKGGLPVIVTARFLGLAGSVGAMVICPLLYRKLDGHNPFFAILPLALLAVNGPLAAWTLSGMETPLFAFLVIAAVYLLVLESKQPRRLPCSAAVFALAALTRPEGFAVFAGALVYRLLLMRGAPRGRQVLWLAAFVTIVGAHVVFRYAYYGFLLPNTFYAKVGELSPGLWLRGARYVHQYATTYFGLPVALSPLLIIGLRRRSDPEMLLLLVVGAYIAAIILEGGDYMPAFRFMVPAVPLLSILMVRTGELLAAQLKLAPPARIMAIVLALIVVFAAVGSSILLSSRYDRELEAALRLKQERREMGEWLHANMPPETLVAANAVGVLAYYARLPILDMYGLTDAHIAHSKPVKQMGLDIAGHEKWDPDYVLSRKPDVIILGVGRLTPRPILSLNDREMDKLLQFEPGDYDIWFNSAFHRQYRVVNVPLRAGNFCFFQRIGGRNSSKAKEDPPTPSNQRQGTKTQTL